MPEPKRAPRKAPSSLSSKQNLCPYRVLPRFRPANPLTCHDAPSSVYEPPKSVHTMHSRKARPQSNLIEPTFGTMVPMCTEKETHGRTQHELPQASIRKPNYAASSHRWAPRSAKASGTPCSARQRRPSPARPEASARSSASGRTLPFKAGRVIKAIAATCIPRSKQAAHPSTASQRKQRGAFRTSCTRP